MEKEFIPYEQALALKELGYNLFHPFHGCTPLYITKKKTAWDEGSLTSYTNYHGGGDYISAPLYAQAFRWFREKHKLDSNITFNHVVQSYHVFIMYKYNDKADGWISDINTYEEAELACLKKLIEIVKSK